MTFERKAKWFKRKIICKQPKSKPNLTSSWYLRSHLRALMALDRRRLIRPGKKKTGRIFLRSTSLLCKILPTNLSACKPTFYTIYTSHLRWNSTMRYCFYHTDLGQNAVFHNLEYKLYLFNIQDDRRTHGLLPKPLKKIPKSPIRPVGSHFCCASCSECLNEYKSS